MIKIPGTPSSMSLLRLDDEGRIILWCPRCRSQHLGPVATDAKQTIKDILVRQQEDAKIAKTFSVVILRAHGVLADAPLPPLRDDTFYDEENRPLGQITRMYRDKSGNVCVDVEIRR